MSFGPADFAGFGGLNLAADAEDSPGALDLSNVSLSQPGPSRLAARPGYTLIGTENLSTVDGMTPDASSSKHLMGTGSDVVALVDTASGAISTSFSAAGSSSDPWTFVRTGQAELWGANGPNFVKVVPPSTITEPTVETQAAGATSFTAGRVRPYPYTLAVQPKDNRLVAAGFGGTTTGPNGTTSSPSHVFFSQPDNGLKWDETDYVILSPDRESIRAACSFAEYLFVFKQSKFFVFYGNSVDSTGGTVFNYRTVGNAFGGSNNDLYQGQVCSAPSGVYVITDTGVWKTTGSAPVLVSPGLSPLFNQNVSTLAYQGTGYTKLAPRSATGSGGSFWHQGKVYFSVTITRSTATTSSGWLILDEQSGQWTVWELADTPRVGASVSGGIVFPSGLSTTGRKGLLSMDGTATTDNGTAIASYYTSPYLTYGEPKAEKHVRASELHGTGTVTLAWGKDLQTHGTAETVAMSSGIGHARTGARGRVLSFKIAASAAGWTVNRVVPMLQAVRTGK